jgi:hypothetical protein
MRAIRYGLPAVLALTGLGFLIVRQDTLGLEMWAMLTGSAISILLFNLLFRLGASGDRERQAEVEAREYFSRHGRWPDE